MVTRLLHILLIVVAFYAILLLYLYIFQRHFIYMPTAHKEISHLFDEHTAHFVTLNTDDNLTLQAIYQPAHAGYPTLVIFFGNASFLGALTPTTAHLAKQGFGVLQVAYRGYSGNPGKPTETGLYRDGRAALTYLHMHGVNKDDIVLYGESLGAAVAIQLATETSVRALVLESPFTSLLELAYYHYPIFPHRFLLAERYESIRKMKQVHIPVLVVHGSNDNIVPSRFGKSLFDAANEPKTFELIEGYGHNNLPDYSRVVVNFLNH